MTKPQANGNQGSTVEAYLSKVLEIVEKVRTFVQVAVLAILAMAGVILFHMALYPGRDHTHLIYLLFGLILALVAFVYLEGARRGSAKIRLSTDYTEFVEGVQGYWWNYPSYDRSLLGVVMLAPLHSTGGLSVAGDNYNSKGEHIASWNTTASCINPSNKTLYYTWEGDHPSIEQDDGTYSSEEYKGFTTLTFVFPIGSKEAKSAKSKFYDIKSNDPGNVTLRLSRLERCSRQDYETMKKGPEIQRLNLIRQVRPGHGMQHA